MAKTINPKSIFYGDAIVNSYDDTTKTIAVEVGGYLFKKCGASTTTHIAAGAGILHAIVLNTNGGTVDIFDSLTGAGTTMGQIATDAPEQTFFYNVAYSTGLTVTTGATANVTVVYRPLGGTVHSASPSPSASASLSPSASVSPSASASPSHSLSPSHSVSPSLSPSASASPSASPSLSPSASTSPSESTSPSASASPSSSPSASISPSWG